MINKSMAIHISLQEVTSLESGLINTHLATILQLQPNAVHPLQSAVHSGRLSRASGWVREPLAQLKLKFTSTTSYAQQPSN